MNGLTTSLKLKTLKDIAVFNSSIDSNYDYLIDDLHNYNAQYNKDYCKTLFFYLLNGYIDFKDGANTTDIRGFELRLFDVEDENNPVITLKTKYQEQKIDFTETEEELLTQCKMSYSVDLFEDITSPDEVTNPGSLNVTVNLSEFPIKNSVIISYVINDGTNDITQNDALNDSKATYNDQQFNIDVSQDQYVSSCIIDYINKTVTIEFDSSVVDHVVNVSVNYKKPKIIDYYIYKAELWAVANVVSGTSYSFDPAPNGNVIERKLLEFNGLENLPFIQTKAAKTEEPNKGIRLTRDTDENTNGYCFETLNIEAIYTYHWDKNLWK